MKLNGLSAKIFAFISQEYAFSIERALKVLLENKHLYQSVYLELPEEEAIFQAVKRKFDIPGQQNINPMELFFEMKSNFPRLPWKISDYLNPTVLTDPSTIEFAFVFSPPTAKMYCGVCKDMEPYNFLYGDDTLAQFRLHFGKDFTSDQVFSLSYQCQGCKSLPEVFLVRRTDFRLTISGRSPMEYVSVPKFLPKKQRKYFSDSVIAFNSGQILAAKFLLRTFLEQYVRSIAADPDTRDIESLFDEYNDKLPNDFKTTVPFSEIHLRTAQRRHPYC